MWVDVVLAVQLKWRVVASAKTLSIPESLMCLATLGTLKAINSLRLHLEGFIFSRANAATFIEF